MALLGYLMGGLCREQEELELEKIQVGCFEELAHAQTSAKIKTNRSVTYPFQNLIYGCCTHAKQNC